MFTNTPDLFNAALNPVRPSSKIVDKAVKPYEDKLSDDDIKQIKELMYKINDLDLNYKAIKDQLNDVTDSLKDKLTTEETKNIFQKIGDFFSDICRFNF